MKSKFSKLYLTLVFAIVLSIGAIGSASAVITPPTMPASDSVYQAMVDMFGEAATKGLLIIGGAVALGLIVIIAMWAWRLLKKWLSSSK
ncbi:MAG TPA: hypothetical protein VGE40_03360 [Bacilli bacterium]